MNSRNTQGAACARLLGFPSPALLVSALVICSATFYASGFREFRSSNFDFRGSRVARLLALSLSPVTSPQSPVTGFQVHEWGTFTSIAGPDGRALEWLPLSGPSDLPSFVEHLGTTNFKGGLRGTIRMETPVLYFYSPREVTVSVHAAFSKGFITEWYPHASVPAIDPRRDFGLAQKTTEGVITWKNVEIQPGDSTDFRAEEAASHYYAARETSSAPLAVGTPSGLQRERFLFYRGVSAVLPPVTATISTENSVLLQNHFSETIPSAILFERRGEKLGYRVLGPLQDQATLNPPTLDGTLDAVINEVESTLVEQGLFPDEAHAMLRTWKDSWFEEGSRVIYFVPRRFVESVLPLTITPGPEQLTRVFVGRIELITPATQQAVESAFAANDRGTLAKYNRFVEPILTLMIQQATDPGRRERLASYLNSAYSDFYSKARNLNN